MQEQEYVSFHGTEKSIAYAKINYNPSNIIVTTYQMELQKGLRYRSQRRGVKAKLPGSLGYGFYTFIKTKQVTKDFISRQVSEYKIIKVCSKFEDDQVLDFNSQETREQFHAFRTEFLKRSEKIIEIFGNHTNNYKQHVMDGLVIENFIEALSKNKNKVTKAVVAWTFTPCDDKSENIKFVSFIPNGLELCIRDKERIISLEEGDV